MVHWKKKECEINKVFYFERTLIQPVAKQPSYLTYLPNKFVDGDSNSYIIVVQQQQLCVVTSKYTAALSGDVDNLEY
jgi:hypothetical protein